MTERLLTRELRSYAVSRSWFILAKLLVEVFLPLVLLKHGFQLSHIFLYNVVSCLAVIPSCYAAGWVIRRYGQRPGFIISYLGSACFQLQLANVIHGQSDLYGLALLALVYGFASGFTQVSSLIHVVANVSDERPGRDNASLQSITQTAALLGPLLGAIISTKFGPGWVWPVACLFLALALYHVRDFEADFGRGHNLRLRGVAPLRDLAANASIQLHSVVGMLVWPVYLAIVTPSYQSIGFIAVLVAGVNVVALVWNGRRVDNGKARRILIETVLAIAVINLARIFAGTYWWLVIISAVYAVAFSVFWSAWLGIYQSHARQGGLSYVIVMEIAGAIGGLIIWGGLALLSIVSMAPHQLFVVAFCVAAVGVCGCLLLRRS